MGRVVWALAAAVLAAALLSACGSSGVAPVAAPHAHAPGAIVFVAGGPSTELGVDNTDIYSATPGGPVRNLTSTGAAESDAAWSDDERHIVFIRRWTTGHANGEIAVHAGVYAWSPGHGTPQRIASCSDDCSQGDFAWSPNDRQIAFVSDVNVYGDPAVEVMNADGSDLHTVCDSKRCGYGLASPRWSPDARKLVFSNEGGLGTERFGGSPPSPIWIAHADGSRLEQLTHPNCNPSDTPCGGWGLDTSPAWSPNGRLIAFSHYSVDYSAPPCGPAGPTGHGGAARQCVPAIATSIDVMRTDGSQRHRIYRCDGESCNQTLPLAWAPDGKAIAFGPITARDPSVHITTLAGKTSTIRTCGVSQCPSPQELTWSPHGRELAFIAGGSSQSTGVWVAGRDGAGLHRVGGATCCLAWLRHVSPNSAKPIPKLRPGRRLHLSGSLVYGPAVNARRPFAVLSFGASRTHRGYLPSLRGKEPVFSPNGSKIAFTGTVAGDFRWHILVADRNGTNVRALTDLSADEPAWSPDGRTLAFTREPGGGTRHWIAIVSAAGGRIRDVTSAGLWPSWSPSGDELVFQGRVASGEALFTVRLDERGARRLINLPGEQGGPAWSPDGKEIAFMWWTPAGAGLYLIRPDGTDLRRVTTATVPAGRPAWSPDGRYLAVMPDDYQATRTQVIVIDVRSGRVSTVATVPGAVTGPSWSSR